MAETVIPVIVTTQEALENALEENAKMIYIDACIAHWADRIWAPYAYIFLARTGKGGILICKPGVEIMQPCDPFNILQRISFRQI